MEEIIGGWGNFDGKSIRMINEIVSTLLLRPLNTEKINACFSQAPYAFMVTLGL
jgi:hypothetical protein